MLCFSVEDYVTQAPHHLHHLELKKLHTGPIILSWSYTLPLDSCWVPQKLFWQQRHLGTRMISLWLCPLKYFTHSESHLYHSKICIPIWLFVRSPFPSCTHATLARDGAIIMTPEYFTCYKHMFAGMLYQGLRQLAYNLHINMSQLLDSITACDRKINNGQPYKGRDWAYLPNSDKVACKSLARD